MRKDMQIAAFRPNRSTIMITRLEKKSREKEQFGFDNLEHRLDNSGEVSGKIF